jgi:TRAP-type C4-dicarboxylate transport system permease small subunit
MTIWHVLLYVAAALLALRSFIQLVTNYRAEYEQTTVTAELQRMQEELASEATETTNQEEPAATAS